MSTNEIILICVSAVLVIVLIAWITSHFVRKNRESGLKAGGVEIANGVRYTKDNKVVDENGNVNITLNKGDQLLNRGKAYLCSKEGGKLLPGKYTLLSTDEGAKAVNVRIGGLVREYKHFTDITLAEGDKITPVSHSIILR